MNATTPRFLSMIAPDDWHLHVRDGDALKSVVLYSAKQFKRAIIMPNLNPPVTTVTQAGAYKKRILDTLPEETDFTPLMTLYLTDNTSVSEIKKAKESGIIHAIKLYPANATTNSSLGVTDVKKCFLVFEVMQKMGLPLLLHGETADPAVDIFDRESVFIDTTLTFLSKSFPELKMVLEHVTTKEAVDYVKEANRFLGATITPHHLLFNRNHILQGGISPHYYCLPILKKEEDREALINAVSSNNERFFSGTDSAPHPKKLKEQARGNAGCFSGLHALELYAKAFDENNILDQLEAFTSINGPNFYGLPKNTEKISLKKEKWIIPEELSFGNDTLVPLMAGETLNWKLQ